MEHPTEQLPEETRETTAEKFDFLKETIKKKSPLQRWGKRIAYLVLAGLIIGGVASGVIVMLVPRLIPREEPVVEVVLGSSDIPQTSAVDIPQSQPSSSVISSSETVESQPEEEEDEEEEEEIDPLQIVSLETQAMVTKAREAEQSLVTVIGITREEDWFKEVYEKQGQLSGLIVALDETGCYILTEYRVVRDVDRIMVGFADGMTADARFVKQDSATNLAVIRVDMQDIAKETRESVTAAQLLKVNTALRGERVMALGSPMGFSEGLAIGRVTCVKNAVSVTDQSYGVINTDISVSEEGSGILVNTDGRVVGIMAQQLTDTKNSGLMTCLKMADIIRLVENLCNNEGIVYVGIHGQEVSAQISDKTGMPRGIWVEQVDGDSPAMAAGITAGDVICKVGETQVTTLREYNSTLSEIGPEHTVPITVMRQSVEGYVEIVFDVTISAI